MSCVSDSSIPVLFEFLREFETNLEYAWSGHIEPIQAKTEAENIALLFLYCVK
jgi:hypothetical protein